LETPAEEACAVVVQQLQYLNFCMLVGELIPIGHPITESHPQHFAPVTQWHSDRATAYRARQRISHTGPAGTRVVHAGQWISSGDGFLADHPHQFERVEQP
jgi:hypothetical protein